MKKLFLGLIIINLLLIIFSNSTLANVGSGDLIEKGKEFDGQMVVFSGEVIGDPMSRGSYLWLNVKDKDNAMGIWVKKAILPIIKYYGSYKNSGDVVSMQGTFHRSCIEHGGDTDIHASSVTVSKVGHPVKHRIQAYQLIMAMIALLMAFFSYFLSRIKGKGTLKL